VADLVESDDDVPLSRERQSSSVAGKRFRGNVSKHQRDKELRERDKERERERAEAAGRRKGRAEKRRADGASVVNVLNG
jgi:hypothetical protein